METDQPVRYGEPGKRYDFMVRRTYVYRDNQRLRGFEVLRLRRLGAAYQGVSIGRFLSEKQANDVAKYLAGKDFVE
jgi:hypothetical protein